MCDIKILVADADADSRQLLVNTIQKEADLTVVAQTGDGAQLLQLCQQNQCDIVVMELVLSTIDGLEVLAQLGHCDHKPKILVLSSFANSRLTKPSIQSAADYFMLKPCNLRAVVERIHQLSKNTSLVENDPQDISTIVTATLQQLGVPVHIQGYQYLRDAITMATTDAATLNAVTKILYPTVAKHHRTTASRVERSIRHAIEVTWDKGNWNTLQQLFGYTISNSKGKPTNSEFIALIADRLQLRIRSGEYTPY